MKTLITIEIRIADLNETYMIEADTVANKAIITNKTNTDVSDYHISGNSNTISKIVDKLGDVKVGSEIINGEIASQIMHNGGLRAVVEAIGESISRKSNPIETAKDLYMEYNNEISNDIPMTDIIRIALSERKDLDKWRIEVK